MLLDIILKHYIKKSVTYKINTIYAYMYHYLYTHICIHGCENVNRKKYMHIRICICMHTDIYVYTSHMYIQIYIYIHIAYLYTNIYVYMYIIYVLMYIFIYVVQILITQLSFHVKSISMMFQQQTDKHADTFLLDTPEIKVIYPLLYM